MGDPVARLKNFVEGQRQQACFEEARAVWAQKVVGLQPALTAVGAVLCEGLRPGQFEGEAVTVLTDGNRDQFPLVVVFAPRVGQEASPLAMEVGASALFRCEPDGHVRGYRYPFHAAGQTLEPEPYVDLGFPGHI